MPNLFATPEYWSDEDDVSPHPAWNPATQRYEFGGTGIIHFIYIGPTPVSGDSVDIFGDLTWTGAPEPTWLVLGSTAAGIYKGDQGIGTGNLHLESSIDFFVAENYYDTEPIMLVGLSGYLSADEGPVGPACFWDHDSMLGVSEDC